MYKNALDKLPKKSVPGMSENSNDPVDVPLLRSIMEAMCNGKAPISSRAVLLAKRMFEASTTKVLSTAEMMDMPVVVGLTGKGFAGSNQAKDFGTSSQVHIFPLSSPYTCNVEVYQISAVDLSDTFGLFGCSGKMKISNGEEQSWFGVCNKQLTICFLPRIALSDFLFYESTEAIEKNKNDQRLARAETVPRTR